jgi:hypothetical protein
MAATIAPVAVALIYAFVRAYTKGKWLPYCKPRSTVWYGGPGRQCWPARILDTSPSRRPGQCGAALTSEGFTANPMSTWATGDYVATGDAVGAYWDSEKWVAGHAPA